MKDSLPCALHRRGLRGFTLIELMIAVAIVAILAAVALPSYQSSVRKSRRADAIATMQQLQQAQERFRANNATYSGDIGAAADKIPIAGAAASTPKTSPDGYYTLELSLPTATSYVIKATPTTKGGQDKDTACSPMELVFASGATQYRPAACWGK